MKTGVNMQLKRLQNNITQEALHDQIQMVNEDPTQDGIIVQLPLPPHLSDYRATSYVDWLKDVDGYHPYNIGLVSKGIDTFMPATVSAVKTLIESEIGIPWLKGKNVCIVGRSDHICKPLQTWLQNCSTRQMPGADATVTIVHEETQPSDVLRHIGHADMVITATNKGMWLQGDHIKNDAIIIDVAFNFDPSTGKTFGDCDFNSCIGIASRITPVPGGVGPLTVSELVKNTLIASTNAHKARQSDLNIKSNARLGQL